MLTKYKFTRSHYDGNEKVGYEWQNTEVIAAFKSVCYRNGTESYSTYWSNLKLIAVGTEI